MCICLDNNGFSYFFENGWVPWFRNNSISKTVIFCYKNPVTNLESLVPPFCRRISLNFWFPYFQSTRPWHIIKSDSHCSILPSLLDCYSPFFSPPSHSSRTSALPLSASSSSSTLSHYLTLKLGKALHGNNRNKWLFVLK